MQNILSEKQKKREEDKEYDVQRGHNATEKLNVLPGVLTDSDGSMKKASKPLKTSTLCVLFKSISFFTLQQLNQSSYNYHLQHCPVTSLWFTHFPSCESDFGGYPRSCQEVRQTLRNTLSTLT